MFLLSGGKSTDLVFDGRGTLLAEQQYFDLEGMDVPDAQKLAEKLRSTPWSALLKWKPE